MPRNRLRGRSFAQPLTFGLGLERCVGACRAAWGSLSLQRSAGDGRSPVRGMAEGRWETGLGDHGDLSQPRLYRGAHSWDTVVLACKSPSVAMLLPVCSQAGPEGRSGVRKGGSPLLRPKGMYLFTLPSQVD